MNMKQSLLALACVILGFSLIAQSRANKVLFNNSGLKIVGYSEITDNGADVYAIVKNNSSYGFFCKGFKVKANLGGEKEVYTKGEYVNKPFSNSQTINIGEFYIAPGEEFYTEKTRKDDRKKTYLNVKSVSGNTKSAFWGTPGQCIGFSDFIQERSNIVVYSNSSLKVEAYLTSGSSAKIKGSRNYNVKFKFINLTSVKITKKDYGLPEKVTFCIGGAMVEYKLRQPKNLASNESYEKETFDFYSISTPPIQVKF